MIDKKDLVKKSLLLGVGIAAYAQDAAEKVAKDLLKKGHLDKKEGQKLVRSVYCEEGHSGKRVAKVMQEELKRLMKISPVKKSKKRR